MIRTIALLFLSGCAIGEWPDVERGADELRARDIVWSSFGATNEAPPSVMWVTGEPCPGRPDVGPVIAIGSNEGTTWKCLLGRYESPMHYAEIVWQNQISNSAYAHELYHGWMWIQDGYPDPDHLDLGWSTVVPRATAMLREAGL